MANKTTLLILSIIMMSIRLLAQNTGLQAPSGLMCNLINSRYVSIGSESPGLSWEINDTKTNSLQLAYQVLIADKAATLEKNTGNIWDSGKVSSTKSCGITPTIRLKPNTVYYWKVRVWNNHGKVSPYAKTNTFYTDSTLISHKTSSYPLTFNDQNPVDLKKKDLTYLADFGKDAFGQLKMNLFSNKENDSVVIRIGERIDPDGRINRKPGFAIRYAQYVVPLFKGLHAYQLKIRTDANNTKPGAIKMPDYIGEVTPFRYCEIEGYQYPLKPADLTRLAVNYNFNDATVTFNSSDSVLNAVWELCKYSIKATSFAGIYVDGDRERVPYEADTYINQLSHYAVDKEFTLARKSHEYLINHATWPTEWILQSVLIAYNDYLYTGDLQSARHYYPDLKAKSLMALEDSNHLISTINGKQSKTLNDVIHFNGAALKDIVDWPHSGMLGVGKQEAGETDGFVFTKYNAVVNAYYYKSLLSMKLLAQAMDKKSDAILFDKKAKEVKIAFQKAFFNPVNQIYADGIDTRHASLHTNMFALAFGLVEPWQLKQVMTFVKSRGMACSVYGSQFLLDAVYDGQDAAYGLSLLTSKSDRSWVNMIQAGSTITMEAWDNKYKPNQDWNHAWGAAPANIISRKLMGIEPLTAGWSNFSVKPQIADLTFASIDVPSIKGNIKVSYQQNDTTFKIDIAIPANTTSQIFMPLKTAKKHRVWVDDKIIKSIDGIKSTLVPNVGSGEHHLKIEYFN